MLHFDETYGVSQDRQHAVIVEMYLAAGRTDISDQTPMNGR